MIRTSKIHKNKAGKAVQLKITIPKDVSEKLGLKGGETIVWKISKKKEVKIEIEE